MLNSLGYKFDEEEIRGIQHRDNSGGLLMMMYTCAVDGCNTKQARTFSKNSYNNGVVLVRCEGCNNLHLIADNLGWFEADGKYKGNKVNIESILKDKGESVHKFVSGDSIEFQNID